MTGIKALVGEQLVVSLELELLTPLMIRGGTSSWSQGRINKARNTNMRYAKENKKKSPGTDNEWTELGDFQTMPEVRNDQLELSFHLPAASLRGAFRTWALRQLLPDSLRAKVLDDSTPENLAAVLETPVGRGVLELFGYAGSGETTGSRQGRIQFESGQLSGQGEALGIIMPGSWDDKQVHRLAQQKFNCACHIKTRSPLDRITGGTLSHGLHSFLEVLPGARVKSRITVRNPTAADTYILSGLLADLDDGLLRVGGLVRIGRGRLKVVTQDWSRYKLKQQPTTGAAGNDPLDWLFTKEAVPAEGAARALSAPLEEVFDA